MSTGWNNAIDTSEVKLGFDPIPAGSYVFRVLAAGPDKYEEGALNIRVEVADGPETGRSFFSRLPNPANHDKGNGKTPWPIVAMKKVEVATGIDKYPAENGIEYFSRLAQAQSTFRAFTSLYDPNTVARRNTDGTLAKDESGALIYDPKPGATGKSKKEQLNWLSVEPGVA